MSQDPEQEIKALKAALRESRWQNYHLFNVQRQRAYHAHEREKDLVRRLKKARAEEAKLRKFLDTAGEAARRLFRSRRWRMAALFGKDKTYAPLEEPLQKYQAWFSENGGRDDEDSKTVPLPHREDEDEALRIPFLAPTVDVVICIYNALEDLKLCLQSVVEKSPKMQNLILVNDGSDEATTAYLQDFADNCAYPVELIHNLEQRGYTIAANQGMRRSSADYVILLNSDTIVTFHWIENLVACGESDPNIGIVGPVSNAASWQSVPERFGADGDWEVNELPAGVRPDDVACRLMMSYQPAYPRVPLLNGFCLAIRRQVINRIGFFDEETFPKGYGEENDYCLRTGDAEFDLAVADNCYIYHAKSKSFTHEKRRLLSKGATELLNNKHSPGRVDAACLKLRDDPGLARLRDAFPELQNQPVDLKVLFLIDFKGEGGGTHSIVQEAGGLRDIGVYAQVAVPEKHADFYRSRYPKEAQDGFYVYQSDQELYSYAAGFDVAVATLFTSIPLLKLISDLHPDVLPAYYIQDYEPLFYEESESLHHQARSSYTLIPGMLRFAKTRWLCERVAAEHGVVVEKVNASIDHSVYTPPEEDTRLREPFTVSAMIRPATPRRAPEFTMRVLKQLKMDLGSRVRVVVFGCREHDYFWDLCADAQGFEFEKRGVLRREQVADLLRESSVFLDLSTYQAFGRTALEAMACGCVPVVPKEGGASDYAVNGENALVVDTSSFEEACSGALHLLTNPKMLESMREEGIKTADEYTITRAARSERDLFRKVIARRGAP